MKAKVFDKTSLLIHFVRGSSELEAYRLASFEPSVWFLEALSSCLHPLRFVRVLKLLLNLLHFVRRLKNRKLSELVRESSLT